MAKRIGNFRFVHLLHAIFILTNLITGFFMLRGIKLFNIHFTSGILIILVPLVLANLSFRRSIFFNLIFLRAKDLKRGNPIKILTKITAMMLFFLVMLSFTTGMILRLGGGTGIFNIHIFSYKTIFTIVPIHALLAIMSKK
ncbi:hypothetical protein HYG86_12565 [Alkalicella caledoniensis]|uniref:Cytochrome b561 bacterial/Ni-hydrogenase domain-containing protein n=1 Tax=Alkalicella caledoniensis TaxID=2731377 RepID=A0A7G9WA30_ALKCA|nr:hypothetical protein [Alkalicella caledoniensis]QNO15542.1 hypothetical protein HYG86_12565 [Alkalicella caledoniensis]